MLRRKDGGDIHSFFQEDIEQVRSPGDGPGRVRRLAERDADAFRCHLLAALQAPVLYLVADNAALVAENGDPLALQQGEIRIEAFIAEDDTGLTAGNGQQQEGKEETAFHGYRVFTKIKKKVGNHPAKHYICKNRRL